MKKIVFLGLFLRIIHEDLWNLFEKIGQLTTPTEGAAGVDDGALLGVLAGGRASVEARPDHPEEDSAHHGEHVAGVGGALLAAQVVVRVVQHARHRQPEVGAEHVHEDRVPGVDGSYVRDSNEGPYEDS